MTSAYDLFSNNSRSQYQTIQLVFMFYSSIKQVDQVQSKIKKILLLSYIFQTINFRSLILKAKAKLTSLHSPSTEEKNRSKFWMNQ
jgi:hypothetical protein